MHDAAQLLLGTHDFRSFETDWPNKVTSVRTVFEISVARKPVWEIFAQSVASTQYSVPSTEHPVPRTENSVLKTEDSMPAAGTAESVVADRAENAVASTPAG